MNKKSCSNCGGNGNHLTDCSTCKRHPEIIDAWIPMSRLKEYQDQIDAERKSRPQFKIK